MVMICVMRVATDFNLRYRRFSSPDKQLYPFSPPLSQAAFQ